MNKPNGRALFAPGELTCTPATLASLRQAGVSGLALLCRHLTGDWGDVSLEQRNTNQQVLQSQSDLADIVSRYRLAGTEIVITTSYVSTPSLRWTDICLADELIEDGQIETDDLDPLAEAVLVMTEAGDEDMFLSPEGEFES